MTFDMVGRFTHNSQLVLVTRIKDKRDRKRNNGPTGTVDSLECVGRRTGLSSTTILKSQFVRGDWYGNVFRDTNP